MKNKSVCVYGRASVGVYHGHADALVTEVKILTEFEGVGMEVQDARCPSGVVYWIVCENENESDRG